jgi:hypothetical protein
MSPANNEEASSSQKKRNRIEFKKNTVLLSEGDIETRNPFEESAERTAKEASAAADVYMAEIPAVQEEQPGVLTRVKVGIDRALAAIRRWLYRGFKWLAGFFRPADEVDEV